MKAHSMDRVEICRADGDTDTAKLKLEKLVFLIMCIYMIYTCGVSQLRFAKGALNSVVTISSHVTTLRKFTTWEKHQDITT